MLHIHEEASRCLLCQDAPCGQSIARAIRAIRFDNSANAWRFWGDCAEDELLAAEKACIHFDRPIRIADLKKAVDDILDGLDKGYDELREIVSGLDKQGN